MLAAAVANAAACARTAATSHSLLGRRVAGRTGTFMVPVRQAARAALSTSSRPTLANGDELSGCVLYERDEAAGTAVVTLHRPNALNALNRDVVSDLRRIFREVSFDRGVRAVVLTGSDQAFAAGADIKEMLAMDYATMRDHDRDESLLDLMNLHCSKPLIAAVNGFAFGGGCELAMLCDIVIAGENAKFGQPEVLLGIMAGAGGTQRLTKAVGRSLSMQMNLTGDPIGAERAMIAGLVSEVTPVDETLARAKKIAGKIAARSGVATQKIKATVLKSFELSLREGCEAESDAFISCWATQDQKEGMAAFVEKRAADWKHA